MTFPQIVGAYDDSAMLERAPLVETICRELYLRSPAQRPAILALAAPPGRGKSAALMYLAQSGRLFKAADRLKDREPSAEVLYRSLHGKHLISVTTSFNGQMTSGTDKLPLVQEAAIRLLYRFVM